MEAVPGWLSNRKEPDVAAGGLGEGKVHQGDCWSGRLTGLCSRCLEMLRMPLGRLRLIGWFI